MKKQKSSFVRRTSGDSLANILTEGRYLSEEIIARAQEQSESTKKQLSDVLAEEGLVTKKMLDDAIAEHTRTPVEGQLILLPKKGTGQWIARGARMILGRNLIDVFAAHRLKKIAIKKWKRAHRVMQKTQKHSKQARQQSPSCARFCFRAGADSRAPNQPNPTSG